MISRDTLKELGFVLGTGFQYETWTDGSVWVEYNENYNADDHRLLDKFWVDGLRGGIKDVVDALIESVHESYQPDPY